MFRLLLRTAAKRLHDHIHKLLLAVLMVAIAVAAPAPTLAAPAERPEKQELKIGFIKLTDCAPLIVAYEKGFFEDEGLYVTLEAQANWKIVLDRVIDGSLDASHMLPGQPLGAALGIGGRANLVAVAGMGVNTLAVTVSNSVWSKMKPGVPAQGGKPIHPISAANLIPRAITTQRWYREKFPDYPKERKALIPGIL